jgi:hypothetical protein
MTFRNVRWAAFAIAGLLAAPASSADDIRPESRLLQKAGAARPFADEKCIEQCDIESDKCMAASDGDPDKVQACDDQYSECLAACDAQ